MSESASLPILDKLWAAGSIEAIAAVLLRLPDGIVHDHGDMLCSTCRALNFAAGAEFIESRMRALLAVRDAHGLLSDQLAAELEIWRQTMSKLAAGDARHG